MSRTETVIEGTLKPDSTLPLVAAVEASCDRFLTNDVRLSAFTDIPVEVLP